MEKSLWTIWRHYLQKEWPGRITDCGTLTTSSLKVYWKFWITLWLFEKCLKFFRKMSFKKLRITFMTVILVVIRGFFVQTGLKLAYCVLVIFKVFVLLLWKWHVHAKQCLDNIRVLLLCSVDSEQRIRHEV